MPCLLLIGIAFPRFVLALLFFFSNYLGKAYDTALWPLVGFFFMPLTTLAYAWAMVSNNHTVDGFYLIAVVLAVLGDLGVIGGGAKSRRDRNRD